MPNTNNSRETGDSLDLARMYGFDPYKNNNIKNNMQNNNNDILNQIYNDEMNNNIPKSGNFQREEEIRKFISKEEGRPIDEQEAEFLEFEEETVPPQGRQSFPTQYDLSRTSSERNMMNTMQNPMMQQENVQNNMRTNQNLQSGTDVAYREIVLPQIVPGGDIDDIASFMKTQIGKNVDIQSIIGTNTLVEKSGVLLYVGENYILINENVPGENLLLIEIPTIRFIRFA